MGMRGPMPTPTAQLEARGSWRAKLNPSEPRPEPGKPKCPKEFSKAERAAWNGVCRVLADMDVLTIADGLMLERYVRYLVRWRACEAFIARADSLTYPLIVPPDASGRPPKSGYIAQLPNNRGYVVDYIDIPQVRESHRLHKALKDAEDRLGLSPAARTRIRALKDAGPKLHEDDRAETLATKFGLN